MPLSIPALLPKRPIAPVLPHPPALHGFLALHAYPQDVTPREVVRANPKADRDVILYGYLRGTNIKPQHRVHIAGVGDYTLQVGTGRRRGAGGHGSQGEQGWGWGWGHVVACRHGGLHAAGGSGGSGG